MVKRVLLLLLAGVRADESEEALSLMQHSKRKHVRPQPSEDVGFGFRHCSDVVGHAQSAVRSGCTELHSDAEHKHIDARAARHTQSAADCGKLTFSLGGDSFNFLAGSRCVPLVCGSVNLKLTTDLAATATGDTNLVYSHFCGQEEVKTVAFSGDCGAVPQGFKRFQRPHKSACDHRLSFKKISRNNLHNRGVMVFEDVLPGIGMSVKADEHYEAQNPKVNGLNSDGTFALLNFKPGTSTELLFEFFEKGSFEPKRVDAFLFNVADLQVAQDCRTQMTVTPEDFAGYYLHQMPAVGVASFAGDAFSAPRTSFKSVMFAQSQQPHGDQLTEGQAQRSVTLLYRNRTDFRIKVAVDMPHKKDHELPWQGSATLGLNLMLGGAPVVECDGGAGKSALTGPNIVPVA